MTTPTETKIKILAGLDVSCDFCQMNIALLSSDE
jgi:hypothetical protein